MSNSETLSLRERKRLAIRLSIHTKALELTETKGFSSFTLDELAKEVGISRRTFFNYFPTKEDAVLNSQGDFLEAGIKESYLAGKYEYAQSFVEELLLMMQDSANRLAENFSAEIFSRLTALFAREPHLAGALFERFEIERAEVEGLIGQKYPQLSREEQRLISDVFMHIHQFTLGNLLAQNKPISKTALIDTYSQFKLFTFSNRSEILDKKKEQ